MVSGESGLWRDLRRDRCAKTERGKKNPKGVLREEYGTGNASRAHAARTLALRSVPYAALQLSRRLREDLRDVAPRDLRE